MKLHFTALLLFLLTVAGNSQMNSSWDIIAGVDYSYRYLTAGKNDSYQNFVDSRNNSERGKFNWRIGFNYNRRLVNNTFFKTGLRIASVGHTVIVDSLTTGVPDPAIPENSRIHYDNWYVEIPVVIRFEKESNGKFSTFWELGLSPYIYLSTLEYRKFGSEKTLKFNKGGFSGQNYLFQLVGSVAFGVNYDYSENLQLFTQPCLRFHLTKLSQRLAREHLYNAGLELGVRWKY